MKHRLAGMAGVLFATAALAAGPGGVRGRMEASMLVTGTIAVAPDRSVSGYTLTDRTGSLRSPPT